MNNIIMAVMCAISLFLAGYSLVQFGHPQNSVKVISYKDDNTVLPFDNEKKENVVDQRNFKFKYRDSDVMATKLRNQGIIATESYVQTPMVYPNEYCLCSN